MSDDERSQDGGRRFTLLIHDENDGMLWAEVEDLPGCFASGVDMNELMEAAAEAIGMYLVPPSGSVAREPAEDVQYAVARAEILLRA